MALGCWALSVLGVAGFPLVLFGRKRLGEATGVSAVMLAASIGTTIASARVDRKTAGATVPPALWTGFALLLQEDVWRCNS